MKAVVVTAPNEFDWGEVSMPTPAANEALVKIHVCGICNSTDRELLAGHPPFNPTFPFLLGHEAVGTVLEVGSEVTRYRVGDRVTRPTALMPGEQRDGYFSGWGGFAEYGLVRDDPHHGLSQKQIVVPSELAPETAFLSIALAETRAFLEQIGEASRPVAGLDVAVVGTGIAGLTLTHWARAAGARTVIGLGRRAERLLLARRCGANLALRSDDPELVDKVRERTGGRMIGLLLEAVGQPDVLPALAPLLAERAVVGIYGAAVQAAYDEAAAKLPEGVTTLRPGPEEQRYVRRVAEELADGREDPGLWRSHVWSPDELHAAFRQVDAGEVIKGCIRMG